MQKYSSTILKFVLMIYRMNVYIYKSTLPTILKLHLPADEGRQW